MYAFQIINGKRHYSGFLSYSWQDELAHNINDTFYDYGADKYYLRNFFIVDNYDRILGADEVEEIFEYQRNHPSPETVAKFRHKQRHQSHTTKRWTKRNKSIVRNEIKEAQICKEWGVKYRRRFTYDTWDGIENRKTFKKSHNGRHSTGWKSHKYRHQWEVNLPK